MLVALVVALRLVDALVGLLLIAPARVIVNLAPGVLVPCRMPAQPAERLRSQRCDVNSMKQRPGTVPLCPLTENRSPFPYLYAPAHVRNGAMAATSSIVDGASQPASSVLRPSATAMCQ